MKDKNLDRRALKTRQSIHEALFSLMQEKSYSKITIQDIIDSANVGRSTFYSHFTTKDELLFSSIEHMLDSLNQYIASYIENAGDKPRLIPVVELFQHIKENSRIMKGLIKAKSTDMFFDKAQAYWNSKIETYLLKKMPQGVKPKIPVDILTNHITSTLINLLKWWVSSRMTYSPIEMDQYFQELVNPVLDSALYGNPQAR